MRCIAPMILALLLAACASSPAIDNDYAFGTDFGRFHTYSWLGTPQTSSPSTAQRIVAGVDASNIETIGRVLYTDYVYFFQAAGIVLLIAMIGAIVLTLRHRPGVRRQDLAAQANRERAKAVEVKSVATGQRNARMTRK